MVRRGPGPKLFGSSRQVPTIDSSLDVANPARCKLSSKAATEQVGLELLLCKLSLSTWKALIR